MSRCRDESPAAVIERLFAEHREALLSFVRARARGRVTAEDVVQQAAAQALRHAGRLRDPGAGRAWLFRITRNVLADELRRPCPTEVAIVDEQMPVRLDDDGERCTCVLALARELKPEYAALLVRVVVEGRPVVDVARELGITANNAMVRLHRARTALKRKLLDHCGTDSPRACLDCACGERGCCAVA
ncbi:MAG: sigma-70 family RNA polymerase sigma factor [Minicystis sp.]